MPNLVLQAIVTTLVREEVMRTVQLREAKATLSALVESVAKGDTAVITRRGQPRAVLVGLDEWNRLSQIPSFGRLLAASGLEEGDVLPRDTSPVRDAEL
ncbi:MAG: type II toxin-antitoxin system Phd/YefM family antitoxin [Rhodospirillaceae bacterium]|nr:type II toxin-antitoxin system Phd/YefM family antitoxin [Rhodospirillaceae bacterium]MDE0616205.1 type II toxin-antitoxin system Phd/YefM family antitoxin [Rhodospirillaceae bacterium]